MSEQLLAGGDVDTVVRVGFLERAIAQRRGGYELHRGLGGEQCLPGRREMWDTGSGESMLTGVAWLEEKREELQRWP